MIFTKIEKLKNGNKYIFQHSVRDGFINNSLHLLCNKKNTVKKIELESASYGIAYWEKKKGLTHCRSWEDEEQVEELSNISKHYPSFFLNGVKDDTYAEKILNDCIPVITEIELKQLVIDFINNPNEKFKYYH